MKEGIAKCAPRQGREVMSPKDVRRILRTAGTTAHILHPDFGWFRVAKKTLLRWHLCPVMTQSGMPVRAELVWTRLMLRGMSYGA
jgi:hypothetical protein